MSGVATCRLAEKANFSPWKRGLMWAFLGLSKESERPTTNCSKLKKDKREGTCYSVQLVERRCPCLMS